MANFFRCKDGHRCENGSLCTEDPNDEGSYYCDCSAAKGNFAGLYCEFEGDNDCEFPQEVSTTWFCTNQGTCALGVASDKSQWTCDCPDEYEGPVRDASFARKLRVYALLGQTNDQFICSRFSLFASVFVDSIVNLSRERYPAAGQGSISQLQE